MAILDAKIDLPAGAVPPDPWEDSDRATLRLDHVISRDREGQPLSYVGDYVWNWTPYEPRGKKVSIYFDYWTTNRRRKVNPSDITPQRESRIRELQHLMCRLIYRDEARKRRSKTATKQKSYGMEITTQRLEIVNKLYDVCPKQRIYRYNCFLRILKADAVMQKIFCFGEILLRLSPALGGAVQ